MNIRHNIGQTLGRYRTLLIFGGVTAAVLVAMYSTFDVTVGSWIGKAAYLLIVVCEALFIASFVAVLRGRWRLVIPVVLWLVGLFFLANVLYFRYWSDLLPLSLIFRGESYNSFVFGSVPTLLRWPDVVYILGPALVSLLYRLMHISHCAGPRPSRGWLCVAAAFVLWLGSQFDAAFSQWRYYRSHNIPMQYSALLNHRFVPQRSGIRLYQWKWKGLLIYLYHNILTPNPYNPVELDDGQRAEIERFLATQPQPAPDAATDSIFAANRHKNLILLVVESLNADVIGHRVSGRSVTPVLDSLIKAPGSISCLSMVTQVSSGASSDGQFMYNTGILPLRGDAVAMLFADNRFPSLARAMGYKDAVEVIVEDGYVWNHNATSSAYGYARLISKIGDGHTLCDHSLVRRSLREIDSLGRPFMMQMVTLSMHYPFDDPGTEHQAWLESPESVMSGRYLMAVNAFDRTLGEFIAGLKARDSYDDSVIIIVSDHDQDPEGDSLSRHPIFFMALNTGLSRSIDRAVGQIDVYPTILQIMGRRGYFGGVGQSMLDARNSSSVDAAGKLHGTSGADADKRKRQAWDISEMIIRGNYFASR